MLPRLKELYRKEICPALMKEYSLSSVLAVPRLERIVLNVGVGEGAQDARKTQSVVDALSLIAGQRAVATQARKAVAGFKLRVGMPIGAKVTLRRDRMYEFLDRLITIALPRGRDFRGLRPTSFDGNGNYALGVKEQIVFPEIDYDKVDSLWGLDVVVCTNTSDDNLARYLLTQFGFPFIKS